MPAYNEIHRERHVVTPGALLVTLLTLCSTFWAPLSVFYVTYFWKPHTWTYGEDIFNCWVINTIIWSTTLTVEYFVYDSMTRNWNTLLKNGFTPARILCHFFAILFGSIWSVLLVVAHDGEKAVPRIPDVAFILRLAIVWFGSDFLIFHPAHKLLHQKFPEVHMLHHCCFVPSFSSDFFINVVDFAVEFGAPVFAGFLALKTDYLGLRDDFAYVVYVTAALTHYVLDHDRLLQLEHFRHHTLLGSNYYIYIQGKEPKDPKDEMRNLILKEGDHPDARPPTSKKEQAPAGPRS